MSTSKLRCHISISADGFVAGPNQSMETPLGEGGEGLHDWVVSLAAWREPHDKPGGEVNDAADAHRDGDEQQQCQQVFGFLDGERVQRRGEGTV